MSRNCWKTTVDIWLFRIKTVENFETNTKDSILDKNSSTIQIQNPADENLSDQFNNIIDRQYFFML